MEQQTTQYNGIEYANGLFPDVLEERMEKFLDETSNYYLAYDLKRVILPEAFNQSIVIYQFTIIKSRSDRMPKVFDILYINLIDGTIKTKKTSLTYNDKDVYIIDGGVDTNYHAYEYASDYIKKEKESVKVVVEEPVEEIQEEPVEEELVVTNNTNDNTNDIDLFLEMTKKLTELFKINPHLLKNEFKGMYAKVKLNGKIRDTLNEPSTENIKRVYSALNRIEFLTGPTAPRRKSWKVAYDMVSEEYGFTTSYLRSLIGAKHNFISKTLK